MAKKPLPSSAWSTPSTPIAGNVENIEGYNVKDQNLVTISPEDYLARMDLEPTAENIAWAKDALARTEEKFQTQKDELGYIPGYQQAPTATATPTTDQQIQAMPNVPALGAPSIGTPPTVTTPPTVEAPTVPDMPAVTPPPTIGAPTVTPAPQYQPSAEESTWAGMYSGEIADIIKEGGRGLSKETQQLMIHQQNKALLAREDENLRIMHNDMERRGITQSGLIFWNQQKIKSATTTALANSMTDIQIKSALMKMASFENALGHAGQFLGYLQEQSKMVYMGKMATWEAQTQANLVQYQAKVTADLEAWKMTNQYNLTNWQANTQALFAQWEFNSNTMVNAWQMENQFNMAVWETQANYDLAVFQIQSQAKMAQWSAQCDIYKLGIAQAYEQDNMNLMAQINTDYQAQAHQDNIELAEMELEAANAQAAAQGAGSIIGTIIGGIFGKI